jgi:NOL1/NOP2/fmu family ribosome biogenesis protein
MKSEKLEIKEEWGIVESISEKASYGYRFFPDKVKGEGFFISCFRKMEEEKEARIKGAKIEVAGTRDKELLQASLNTLLPVIKENDFYSAATEVLLNEYGLLRAVLNIQYKGVELGQIMKNRLVPSHALAMSNLMAESIPKTELSYNYAILYLQRQDLKLQIAGTGWQLVTCQNKALGWINALPNRINNYYPKELRILKQHNDAAFEK